MRFFKNLQRIAAILLICGPLAARAEVLEEIIVTADLLERSAAELPGSVTVLDTADIEALAVQHFEDLVGRVPNLNWSGDGNRARYFQIRGVGELEQYEGAPNPSVGFLVDDIDFSGIGTIATLFDVERVEVLRGPQGSRYGANALAGLVYLQSTMPAPGQGGRLELSAGGDDARAAGVAFGGALAGDDRLLYRLSAHHYRSDGFRDNTYLARDDTNGRDETTLRARLRAFPRDDVEINAALLFADVDNGYDAFALDNSYTVLSDNPGRDAQRSLGASLRVDWQLSDTLALTSITAAADSDIDFDFDADWGNADRWAPFVYDYVSRSSRARQTVSQELRLESTGAGPVDWLGGVYLLRLEDELDTRNRGEYFDPFSGFADSLDTRFSSEYRALNAALFGHAGVEFGEHYRLSAGLRVERRGTDYADSDGLGAGPSETMAGGELTLSRDHGEGVVSYLALSRGYRAGGFNLGPVPAGRREFGREAMSSLEAGIKTRSAGGRLAMNLAVFLSRRHDQQVRTSFQVDPGDPASFVFFTDNAASGETLGLEADVRWLPVDAVELTASLGLLDARFDEFRTPEVDLGGRRQAHAPPWTFALGAALRHPSGWFARVDVSGKDAFYFDVSHDQRSSAYARVDTRAGFDAGRWSIELWGRNVGDERYAVRGFYFGNEPPDFPATLYTRAGDPRQFGLTFRMNFRRF